MKHQPDLISGPFLKPPTKAPGTAIVILGPKGASLYSDMPAARQPSEKAAPTGVSLPSFKTLFNKDVPLSERLGKAGGALLRTSADLASQGTTQLVKAAKGTELGAKIFGVSEGYYLVRISKCAISEYFTVPSGDDAIYFIANIHYEAVVVDPCYVVEHGVTDVAEFLRASILKRLREIAAGFKVEDVLKARAAMQKALDGMGVIDAVRLDSASIDLKLDDSAQELLRQANEKDLKVRALNAQADVDATAHRIQKGLLQNHDDLLARWLMTKDDAYRQTLDMRLAQAQGERERNVTLLQFMLTNKIIEPQDIWSSYPDLANDMIKSLSGVSGSAPAPVPHLEDLSKA